MRATLLLLSLLGAAELGAAQGFTRPGSLDAERHRIAELGGARPAAMMFTAPSLARAPSGLSFNPAAARLVLNGSRPWGFNDGALWAGKGMSGRLQLGARYRTGPLTVTLDPEFWFAQNASFDTVAATFPDRTPFNYPWSNRIDLPQQPGPDALARVTPGQSSVRLDWRAVTAGLGTESMVWGPAARHPILMGLSAAGFPHVDVGLRPTATRIGVLEGRVVWGRLTESAWFDTVPGNDHRLLAGLLLAWRPSFLPDLTVGFQRVFYQTWTDTLNASDFFAIVQPFKKDAFADSLDPEGNDIRDQMASLTWRWVFPAAAFEVYGEWARNDHDRNWLGVILEPDHSQGWMLGLQKVVPSGDARTRVQVELLHGEVSTTRQVRANPTFYAHHLVRQGYTERGQILGAGPGPGSDAQFAAVDRFLPRSHWGLWVERVRWFNDDYYRLFGPTRLRLGHNVTLEGGARYGREVGNVYVESQASLVREFNRHFVIGAHRWHVNLQVGGRWAW